ncbi:Parvalbumin [Trema orientale]|uniref:Parvalbumin n=1 Tax=Trema orientale TaxID=63057 RepID=A0A2P5D2A3_TREOI|nr:Parvalbumin [Trema orientale]
MKFVKNLKLSPKRLFRSSKERYSPSNNLKSGAGNGGSVTPKSVLPEISGDWSDFSNDIQFDLSEAFKLIDRDNDGIVSRKELEALLLRLSGGEPSHDVVATMLSEVDSDGDGCISVAALTSRLGSAQTACEPTDESELREVFEFFDTDRDGKISAEELLSFFTAVGDDRCTLEDCRRMIDAVDKNKDGFVCFEDFSVMMERHRDS